MLPRNILLDLKLADIFFRQGNLVKSQEIFDRHIAAVLAAIGDTPFPIFVSVRSMAKSFASAQIIASIDAVFDSEMEKFANPASVPDIAAYIDEVKLIRRNLDAAKLIELLNRIIQVNMHLDSASKGLCYDLISGAKLQLKDYTGAIASRESAIGMHTDPHRKASSHATIAEILRDNFQDYAGAKARFDNIEISWSAAWKSQKYCEFARLQRDNLGDSAAADICFKKAADYDPDLIYPNKEEYRSIVEDRRRRRRG